MQFEPGSRRTLRCAASLAVLVGLSLASIISMAAQPTRRIHFQPGATSAQVQGRLSGMKDEANFVLKAKKGQHMRATITADGATRGMVYFPSGKQDGGPGGLFFDGDLTETGDYRISVYESQMADAWKGRFTLEVEIR